jgi:two-component system cell cycle sensor histidine kinase/response regulator CckA
MSAAVPNSPATILIVDDLAANRETLIELLDAGGYRLLEAADGPAALQAAAEHAPDLILLDVMMPGMDGFEVCRRLRADERSAEMPVILVTALDDQASRLAGIEAGADDFITKPFNRAELRARVRTITRLNRYARLHHERAKLQLAEQRIREQEEILLRAQRLENLGALASGIVHDLNNVLAPILMASELLRTDAGDPEAPQWLEIIDSSAKRGTAMVRQILSFARGSGTGKQALQLTPLVRDLEKMLKDTFPQNVTCHSQVAADLWPVMADNTQVYQVLLNFAVNARDAMPGGGRLDIDVKNATVDDAYARINSDAQPGSYVAVSVTDTGDGIAPEDLTHIFDPFFTTKAPDKGTGLGLATVRQVINAHGGFLDLESQVGKGTRFTVYLPAIVETSAAEASAAPPVYPHGNNQLVLVADDEAAIRQITKATLENYGYRVVLAGDGTEAVARFAAQSQNIDLLVTDLQMPYMDGLAAIRAIRRLTRALPVIAVSGSPEDHARIENSGLDVQALLTKPLSAAILLTEIDRVLHA